jgi:hypothetical protein
MNNTTVFPKGFEALAREEPRLGYLAKEHKDNGQHSNQNQEAANPS